MILLLRYCRKINIIYIYIYLLTYVYSKLRIKVETDVNSLCKELEHAMEEKTRAQADMELFLHQLGSAEGMHACIYMYVCINIWL